MTFEAYKRRHGADCGQLTNHSCPLVKRPPLDEPLTAREFDILELLAQRYQDKEIAAQLCIAPTTVKTHLKHLYQKLQVSTRCQAVAKGQALGLLTHR